MADVGIVMPVYRQNLDHLRIALRSVLDQSYRNYKFVIVGDGAPEDVVRTIYEETDGDGRVQVVLKPKNEGVAEALNLGFDILMADPEIEYLTWVSSDNYYYPYFLMVLYTEMVTSPPEVGLIYSAFRQILEDGSPAHEDKFLEKLRVWQNVPKQRLLDRCIIGPAFLHRTSVCRIVGHYRLDPVQDYDYWIRMSEHCEIKFIPFELMDYRLNSPFSLSTSIRNSRDSHRKCWDAAHTAQFEGRQRRGIRPAITVVFPVRDLSGKTLKMLEAVVDQSYSNFKLYLMDLTSKGNAGELLKTVRDPRIRVKRVSSRSWKDAILSAIRRLKTRYTIVVGEGSSVKSKNYFKHMARRQEVARKRAIVSARYRGGSAKGRKEFDGKLMLGELYRTDKLKAFIAKNRGSRISMSGSRRIMKFKRARQSRSALRRNAR
ncbi:glycosyltransferase [Cohnella kolymensis]|uniref:glycosyltransferase n=1 Tax=Cohnella kolymensis TaxID=1590652 RepID=UPI0006976102|nr:glycosyltransferase [Cohnella kolymensis]